MKYIKLYEEHINEIGDAGAKPYKWEYEGRSKEYSSFTTDSGLKYLVQMEAEEDYTKDGEYQVLRIEYGVEDQKDYGVDYNKVTNRGEMFRVMATVTQIAKEVIKENPAIKAIEFSGSKNKGMNDQRRNNFYMAYIKKHLKVKDIDFDGNTYIIELK
tara:strand:- start:607 stop:1077 length:471 start_codon:yes stop_codon:yes gene_type:complete